MPGDRTYNLGTCRAWGLNLQPRYMPQLGIEPATFWCRDGAPTGLGYDVVTVYQVKSKCRPDKSKYKFRCLSHLKLGFEPKALALGTVSVPLPQPILKLVDVA